ncbi:MAG: hypothetical protein PF441_07885 [Desulfuromusa sp.]|jgi:hypothetical protein|nr:hypothetical protein [Desulfuromusa sp.]
MTRGTIYLIFIAVLLFMTTGLLITSSTGIIDLTEKRQLVQALGITDLSLSSEARYTRHPSQADLFSAFQDFPAAFEHFPTGSIIAPNPVGFFSRVKIQHHSGKQN